MHKPVFNDNGYAGLSDMALRAIGGILKNASQCIDRLLRADHQFVQAPGTGFRGAGQSGGFAAQPQRLLPDSDVLI